MSYRGDSDDGGFTEDDVIFIETKAARNYSDPFVFLWEGPTQDAAPLLRSLERGAVPTETDAGSEPGITRLLVPKSYEVEAKQAIGDPLMGTDDDYLEDEFRTTHREPLAIDWLRVSFGVVATLIIIGLLLSYLV